MSKITVFSRAWEGYGCGRFLEEGERLGLDVSLGIPGETEVVEGVVLLRTGGGGKTRDEDFLVLRELEGNGIRVVNGAGAVELCCDKFRAGEVLRGAGLSVPETYLWREGMSFDEVVELLGCPFVAKCVRGFKGEAVELCHSVEEFERFLERFVGGPGILVQKFVESSRGRDLRVLVVGGKVFGAMVRQACGDEFRSNVALGAEVSVFEIDDDLKEVAERAAGALGVEIAGVDFLFDGDSFVIAEVNCCPGFAGFERITGKNVAAAILESL